VVGVGKVVLVLVPQNADADLIVFLHLCLIGYFGSLATEGGRLGESLFVEVGELEPAHAFQDHVGGAQSHFCLLGVEADKLLFFQGVESAGGVDEAVVVPVSVHLEEGVFEGDDGFLIVGAWMGEGVPR
jgi:hypothetical protein